MAPPERLTAPDPFVSALALLEGATAYTGFVVAVQTQAGSTGIAAKNTTAKLRTRVNEEMALRDSGAPSDDDEDQPSTAIAQLRELAAWLSRDGKHATADDAEQLAESIALTYGVE